MPIDLEKIGQALKEKREEKGLTVSDISDSLCLRKSLIQAIESGEWQILPHEVYVRGYVREYAHLLNMNGEITSELNKSDEKPTVVEIPVQQKVESATANRFKSGSSYTR